MKVFYLGLFDWKNRLLGHPSVEEVAGIFLGEPTPPEDNDGWFRRKNVVVSNAESTELFDSLSVTHSRIILEKSMPEEEVMNFGDLRDKRQRLENAVVAYIKKRMAEGSNYDSLKKILNGKLPSPFIYFYLVIILGRANRLYASQFFKESDNDWRMPVDLSTSCFFTVLDDTGRRPWRIDMEKKIYMRISGSSLIMGKASSHFTHRIINMLYYAGLYEMTRIPKNKLESRRRVHFGLEPLLERQGEEIANTISQRTEEEKIASINRWLPVATVVIGVVSILLALISYWHQPTQSASVATTVTTGT